MKFIKDEEFIRGNCPMTKEDIRILSIAKLELEDNYRILDIGAGTGSVSIQAAKLCPKGEVVAVEKDKEALEVIMKNKDKFNAINLKILEGEALELKDSIEGSFDGIFIGGSGGNLKDIIEAYDLKLKIGNKMVLNFITINNLYIAMDTLKKLGYEVECIQASISKTRGQSYILMGSNPIFIISGRKIN